MMESHVGGAAELGPTLSFVVVGVNAHCNLQRNGELLVRMNTHFHVWLLHVC